MFEIYERIVAVASVKVYEIQDPDIVSLAYKIVTAWTECSAFRIKYYHRKLSVRETEALVRKYIAAQQEKPAKTKTPDDSAVYREIENNMKSILGAKVGIKKQSKNKGKIEISYFSMEELERIIELINKLK